MPTSVALFSQIVRIEDGIITNSGAITDSSIAAVLSEATIDGAKPNIARSAAITPFNGNDSVNRAIPHGLGVVPKFVILSGVGAYSMCIVENGKINFLEPVASAQYAVTSMDATNIYVGNASDYNGSCNGVGYTYSGMVIA